MLAALSDPVRLASSPDSPTANRHAPTFALPVSKSTQSSHFKVRGEASVIRRRDEGTRRLNQLQLRHTGSSTGGSGLKPALPEVPDGIMVIVMPEPRSAPPPASDQFVASAAHEPSPTVLELYKLAVQMADQISARRSLANAFFLSIQTAFISAIGISLDSLQQGPLWIAPVIALAGLAISMTWWLQLRSYRDLNHAKFQVINEIEAQLPVKIFTDEWRHLTRRPTASWRTRYTELGFSERMIPWVFAFLHGMLLLGRLLA